MFPDGRRQIYDIVLPGDLIAYEDLLVPYSLSSTMALSDLKICVAPREALKRAIEKSDLNRKLASDRCLAYLQRLRSLIAALGRQAALPRFAAMVLSLQARLRVVGQADDAGMPFHLRQRDIADVLGLTSVHAGRVLRSLAADKVLKIEADRLVILNSSRLLHLSQR